MMKRKIMAAGLSVLMMLSGTCAVSAEETSQSAESEIIVEDTAETAAESTTETAAESAAGSRAAGQTESGEEAADVTADERAHASNDYEYNYSFETYTEANRNFIRVMVEIKNVTEDKNLYVSGGTIDLEDADGHLVRCINQVNYVPRIIYPGNTGYMFCERGDLDGIEDIASIQVKPDFVIRNTSSVLNEYEDSDISFRVGGDYAIEANGRITNSTGQDVNSMDVYIAYFDKDMKLLGIGGSTINDVPAGATRSFGMRGLVYGDTSKIGDAVNYEFFVSDRTEMN